MKLVLNGHDERYTVEQSLMNLFPGELPVYEPILPGDESWAVITLREEDGCRVTVELRHGGKTAAQACRAALSGTEFEREGQRRQAIARCFFLAARAVTGATPPWGMLTGVRPDKPVTWALAEGKTPDEAVKEFDGKGYGELKMAVGEAVVSVLKPLQDEVARLEKDKAYIDSIIKENGEKAAYFANKTLRKVQKKVGFPERIR